MDLELIKISVLALLAGFFVGMLFTAIKLPLPAPPHIAGVIGILGVFLGYKCWTWIAQTYFNAQ